MRKYVIVMIQEKKTIVTKIIESFSFGNYDSDEFDSFLFNFDWLLKNKTVEFKFGKNGTSSDIHLCLLELYWRFLKSEKCEILVFNNDKSFSNIKDVSIDWDKLINSDNDLLEVLIIPLCIRNSDDREKALEIGKKYTKTLNLEYEKTLRYFLNELLYNTIEHGRNSPEIPSLLQFFWNEESSELSFIVADVGVGIKQHLRQTYPNLSTDSEAILHSIKPQISGTFGRPNTGYETKNNAGVGLFFSSNIAQRLNADMYIVSGNGFVHISPTEITSKELVSEWKGTFVYVKMKLDLIEDLNFQKMLAEITKSIPKLVEVTEDNNLYISVRNYFGKYAEDKDLAKKIRDEKLLIALSENKSLTIDFEDIISAPHSLLNAMLATPIERLGLSAYKKIKIINAAPEIRETLDFIFDDNTSNA
jgi:STAS-like domain of unknown function (DUF4325)